MNGQVFLSYFPKCCNLDFACLALETSLRQILAVVFEQWVYDADSVKFMVWCILGKDYFASFCFSRFSVLEYKDSKALRNGKNSSIITLVNNILDCYAQTLSLTRSGVREMLFWSHYFVRLFYIVIYWWKECENPDCTLHLICTHPPKGIICLLCKNFHH